MGTIIKIGQPEKLQKFYEMAMSIGNSLNLLEMLHQSLTAYLDNLDCMAGSVFWFKKKSDGSYVTENIFSLPYTIELNLIYKDVFENLLDKQMTELKSKLEILKDDLDKAHDEERCDKACEILLKHFEGFPVPTVQETARAAVRSMNNTGSSS